MRKQSHSTNAHRRHDRRSQRGSIIVYLIVALVTFGVLALAGLTRFGATVTSILSPNCATSARLMAESGVRYAMARLRACADATALNAAITAMNGTTYTVNATAGQSFTLSIGYNSSTYIATVTATGNGCTVASPVVTASATNVNLPVIAAAGGGTPSSGTALSFASNIAAFAATSGFEGTSAVTIDTTAKTISLGSQTYENSASVWYTGSNDVCTNGNCTLGNGLCAYWEYQFTSNSQGDGYVWTLMSGDTNTKFSNGGDPNMGELMGYGGLGSSGLGIQAPKLGVEFDIYQNSGCPTSSCYAGTRCDSSNGYDHIAFLYWGNETVANCDKTYDDNRHAAGAGTSALPTNASNTDSSGSGSDGYYYRTGSGVNADWMRSGSKYLYRYELDRATTPDALGNYCYRVRSWIKKSTDTVAAGMSNCTATYSSTPEMTQTLVLNAANHEKLNKVFFGWAEGTGGATQLVALSNFYLDFKSAPVVPIVPSDYSAAWTFYELSGSTAHDLKGVSTGTLSGTYFWGGPGMDCPLPGVICPNSGYLDFSNTARMTATDNTNLDLLATGTVAAWIYVNSFQDYGGIIHKGTDISNESYSLQFSTSGRLALQLWRTDSSYINMESAANLMVANRWYHVAGTWDASSAKLYINGSEVKSVTNSIGAVRNVSGPLLLGAQQTSSPHYYFDGRIDEVYLFKRALTAAEIANMALGHP